MNWWQRLRYRDRLEVELDAELRFHFDQMVEDHRQKGMTEDQARRRARAQLVTLDKVKEECRDARGTRWFEDTVQDTRVALRVLLKDRSFSAIAILMLALGIGANTAMFSIIESVLLQPLPYRQPDRLVWITENNVTGNNNLAMVFGADFNEWRSRSRSFDALSVLFSGDATMGGDSPAVLRVVCLSESVMRLFGVTPVIGRDFTPQDFEGAPQAPGLRASPVNRIDTGIAILSDRLYRRFGADPGLLGGPLLIGNVRYTIVGVLPPAFRLPIAPTLQLGVGPRSDVDVLLNTAVDASARGPGAVLGRLTAGVGIDAAHAELEGIRTAANQFRSAGQSSAGLSLQLASLHDHIVGRTREVLFVLWASVGFVLLVACINIVSLLLARSITREQETAIRSALGASRWRLVRQTLVENMLVASAGGAAGLLLGYGLIRILARTGGIDVPRLSDSALNANVLLFIAAIVIVCGAFLSLLPSLRSSVRFTDQLRASRSSTSSSGVRRWHAVLVISEIALTMIPLTGAGLMLRSLWQVRAEGAALTPDRVLMGRVYAGGGTGSAPAADRVRQSDQILASIEALHGVEAAAFWSVSFGYPAAIVGLPTREQPPTAMWFNVSPHYLEASGLQLLAGRWFTEQDRATPVVVVSERFARNLAGDLPDLGSIVGRTTRGPFAAPGSSERDAPMQIIGVVSDFRSGRLGILQPDDTAPLAQVLFPDALRPAVASELLVRASANPLALVEPVRNIVESRPGTRLMSVRTLADQLSSAVAPRRFNTLLIVGFAVVAMLLTMVGIAGILSYAVAERTPEIGLRLALGANHNAILKMVLVYAAGLVFTGAAAGVAGSVALSKVIGGVLYGVSPTDPIAYLIVVLLLVGVAIVAVYLPARRAMGLDPMTALRRE